MDKLNHMIYSLTFRHGHFRKSPVLINLGRGDIISEPDIVNALDVGWLSAAHLDVFDVEPLSQESPLWKHPKVNI